ncbi:MAG: sulfotransferase domain-containing protein [Proteobacteria bacterium]|nr:sulfotransferase domain-containing protein [Pseudomonadota bacterium]MDA1059621.1 sulfotransferase domain-containing protein [Pseudomonadota bacterium]
MLDRVMAAAPPPAVKGPQVDAVGLGIAFDPQQPFSTDACAHILMGLEALDGSKPICLLDLNGEAALLGQAAQRLSGRTVSYIAVGLEGIKRRTNGPERNFSDAAYSAVVALCRPSEAYRMARFIADHFRDPGPIVLPFLAQAQGGAFATSIALGANDAIITATVPGAGSKRFIPVFQALMWMYGYDQHHFPQPCFNTRYIDSVVDPGRRIDGINLDPAQCVIPETIGEDYFAAVASRLDRGEWVEFHHPVRTRFLADLGGTKSVYLYRDPRDIITTHYHRIKYDTGAGGFDAMKRLSDEDLFIQIMRGYEYIQPQRDYYARGMALDTFVAQFVDIAACDTVYGLRFEDIRYQPRAAYRALIDWLGLSGADLVPTNDDALDRLIHLGSFAHQSGGKIEEGRDATHIYNDGSPAIARGLRRGIAGDWQNHFTPKVSRVFKDMAGDALVALGYEADLDW